MSLHLQVRVERFSDALVDLFQKRKFWFLSGFSIVYLAFTCMLASHKMMWNDELYTFYISRLPGISEVWSTLLTGAEQTPLLFYLITRASFALFGATELSIRLPEILGFWIMCLCLFWFVSRRTSALYGFISMLFPLGTGAFYYAYDARPYGLVLGFAGLALLCWQSAAEKSTERSSRKIWLAGLCLSLAAAVSSHYYAVLVFLPLAFGEAVRSLSSRRLDLPIWLMFILGAMPLIGFLPLIGSAMSYSSTFWSKPEWISVPKFYYFLLTPAAVPLTAMLFLSAIYPSTPGTRLQTVEDHQSLSRLPAHEWAVALGFFLIPVVTVPLCMVFTGAFTDRYVIAAVIGVSIISALAFRRLFFDRPAVTALMILIQFLCFISLGLHYYSQHDKERFGHLQTEGFLQSKYSSGNADGLPIAVSDPHTFMKLAHYAPPNIARRIIYLADTEASLRYIGHNSVEKGMIDMIGPWFHLEVVEYQRFVSTGKRFLVYSKPDQFLNWLLSDLDSAQMHMELLGRDQDAILLLVDPKVEVNTPATTTQPGVQVR
jgi:Dolichyl-phosphate-mannose-protein mannosyltransferase